MTGVLRLLVLVAVAGCAKPPPDPPPPNPRAPAARLEPAPRPFVWAGRRGGTAGSLEIPLPPKMPLGTGAVPVSGGAVRGSVVTGFRESF